MIAVADDLGVAEGMDRRLEPINGRLVAGNGTDALPSDAVLR